VEVQAQRVATPSAADLSGVGHPVSAAFARSNTLPADRSVSHEAQIGTVPQDIREGTRPITAGAEARNTPSRACRSIVGRLSRAIHSTPVFMADKTLPADE